MPTVHKYVRDMESPTLFSSWPLRGGVRRLDRVAAASALVSPAVAFAGILLAILLTPGFSLATNALSDLGAPTAPAAWAFNGGLVLGGLLALPFAYWRVRVADSLLDAAVGVLFAFAALAMAGVGVFPLDTALHAPVAVTFYLLLTATLGLDGTTGIFDDDAVGGLKRVGAASVHVATWLLWGLFGDAVGIPGLAIPETVGALLLAWWLVAEAPLGEL